MKKIFAVILTSGLLAGCGNASLLERNSGAVSVGVASKLLTGTVSPVSAGTEVILPAADSTASAGSIAGTEDVTPSDFAEFTGFISDGIPSDAAYPALRYAEGSWKYYLDMQDADTGGVRFNEFGLADLSLNRQKETVIITLHPRMAGDGYELYPETECTLDIDENVFHLLVRAVLSAQCTDVRVNEVTAVLFDKYPDFPDFLTAGEEEIGRIIKPCGFWKVKAHYLYEMARMLKEDFGGQIPKTQEELQKFPGVGRKVANLIVSEMFGVPAVVVDTHCMRVSGRLGLSCGKNPSVIEQELMKAGEVRRGIELNTGIVKAFHRMYLMTTRG